MFIGCGTLLCGKPYCVTFEYGEEKALKLTCVVDYMNVYWLWYIAVWKTLFCDISINQSIKFISRSICTKMNKKYIFHKLTGKRWKLKLATYKHFPFVQ